MQCSNSIQRNNPDGVNRYLIRALTLNQYLILGLAVFISALKIFTTGGASSFGDLNAVLQWYGTTDIFDLNLSIERLLLGISAATPLLLFSNFIESTDRRAFANINFSTITMCLTLFGRRSVPPNVFLPSSYRDGKQTFPTTTWEEAAKQSLIMSIVTGLCEETVFRRLLPAMILLVSGVEGNVLVPYLGQALLFGLGHAQQEVGCRKILFKLACRCLMVSGLDCCTS
jgi:membrane protease YdiL (CAAX protease family)